LRSKNNVGQQIRVSKIDAVKFILCCKA